MLQALSKLLEALGKFFSLIFVKQPIQPTPEPVPPPTPVPPPPTPPPPPKPAQNRIMYDSTNIYDIPTSAQMVGYYVDGLYSYSLAVVRARFPNAVLVGISAIGTDAGIVGDVENGDMTAAQSVDWVLARRRAGVDPSLYFSLSLLPTVVAAFRARGVLFPHWWDAEWTEVPHITNNAYATQYAHPPYSGGHYDLSLVTAYWPGVG